MTGKNQRGEDGREIALEARARDADRLFSPSAARNRDAIREVFVRTMPAAGHVLEVGSGTGEHAVLIAQAVPAVTLYPGDPDPASRASIRAWTVHLGLANVTAPHDLDVTRGVWPGTPAQFDGIMSCNMIHIAPFSAAQGLLALAGDHLASGGRLFLYGPFSRNGIHTAPSNVDFDASLKSRDAAWGVRDLERDLVPLAARHGLSLREVVEMPANNLAVIFERGQRA